MLNAMVFPLAQGPGLPLTRRGPKYGPSALLTCLRQIAAKNFQQASDLWL